MAAPLMLRKNIIIKKLSECGAFSEETARTFEEAGIFNPNAFGRLNDKLVRDKVLGRTQNGKYYINR